MFYSDYGQGVNKGNQAGKHSFDVIYVGILNFLKNMDKYYFLTKKYKANKNYGDNKKIVGKEGRMTPWRAEDF